MDMVERLNLAVQYIEENLCGEIEANQLSRIACINYDSFCRFFSYIAGMSVSEYIRRRRLTLAAYELRDSTAKVIEIAAQYGYDSEVSFSKAFSKQHLITPTAARKPGAAISVYPPVSFHIMIKGADKMNFRIVETNEIEIYGISKPFAGTAAERFPQEHFMWSVEFDNVPGQICDGFDGLWYGVWSDNNYTIARTKTDIAAENLERHTIPAGTYAAFTSEPGGFAGDVLSQLRDQVINSWLPDSGYERASDMEIELYHLWTDREMRRNNRYYELWIPIRRK